MDLSSKERQFLQWLAIKEILRHRDALLADFVRRFPDSSFQDLSLKVDFSAYPPRIHCFAKTAGKTPTSCPPQLVTAKEIHAHAITDERQRNGIQATLITVVHPSSNCRSKTTFYFAAELSDYNVPRFEPIFEARKRPACIDKDGKQLEAAFDEIDELARRAWMEAFFSPLKRWDEDLVQAVVEKYLRDVGDARKAPLYY